MSDNNRKTTKASHVYSLLHSDITCGKLPVGEKLQMDALKKRYNVGYTPLREALAKLVSQGLVKQEQQCGFHVAAFSLKELTDLYQIRARIDSIALEMAIKNGDAHWEADLMAAWHLFANYFKSHCGNTLTQESWENIQKTFFHTLMKGSNSPCLLKIHDTLYDLAARYRGVCIQNHKKNPQILEAYIKKCHNLVKAVLAKDLKKALSLSEAMWKQTIKTITEKMPE